MHTEDTIQCDLQLDIKEYPEILRNNHVVQIFLERYPEATTTTKIGMSESLPPKAWLPYLYEYGNGTNITLHVNVRDCVDDVVGYVLTVENENRHDTHKFLDSEMIIDVFEKYESSPSYKIREDWINFRGQMVSIFASSIDKLIERGYLINPVT